MKLVLAFMFSLLLAWGKCERTACSTSRRLPWEGRPNPGKPPLVTPADPRALLPADGYSTVMTVSTSQIFNIFMKYNFLQNLNSLFYFDSKYCN